MTDDILTFRKCSRMIAYARFHNLVMADAEVLLERLFGTDVRLFIAGKDLLRCGWVEGVAANHADNWWTDRRDEPPPQCTTGCSWQALPLLAVTWNGLLGLDEAEHQGFSRQPMLQMADSGQLELYAEGADVRVRSFDPPRDVTIRQDFRQLKAAWDAFAAEVRTYLTSELPELAHHAEYGPWFRGERRLPEPTTDAMRLTRTALATPLWGFLPDVMRKTTFRLQSAPSGAPTHLPFGAFLVGETGSKQARATGELRLQYAVPDLLDQRFSFIRTHLDRNHPIIQARPSPEYTDFVPTTIGSFRAVVGTPKPQTVFAPPQFVFVELLREQVTCKIYSEGLPTDDVLRIAASVPV